MDPLRLALPLLLAEAELLDLARRRLRELAELDRLRALEVREPFAAELDELLLGDPGARAEADERRRHLAPLGLRHGDDRRLEHRRVLHDRGVDLDRRDVLAAA